MKNLEESAKRIMVVDDDPAIVEATTLILQEFGYEVVSYNDGGSVYQMETKFPDLFLLDIWMSGHDGRQICKYLKENPKTQHIPVILISASRDIQKSAQEAGADDFIEKPFEIDDLIEKISSYVN